jgi:hypothetical protein
MNEVLLSIEGVSVYTLSAFVFLAFLWASFVFYKKAIEYHESEEVVFNAVLLMGILAFVFSRFWFVASKLEWFYGHWIRVLFLREYPGMSGWGVLLGVLLGALIVVNRFNRKLFDWLDLVALGLSAGMPIVYAAKGALSVGTGVIFLGMTAEMVKALFLSLWFFFLWWVEGEYRTYDWYRFRKTQARTGFVTGVFVFGFGFINLLVNLKTKTTAIWYVYAILVVVGALVVYIRSERKFGKDLRLVGVSVKKLLVKNRLFKWPVIKIK